MTHINIDLDDESDLTQYLDRCARLRNISLSSLVKRLLDTIAEGQLVANVLDDEGDILKRRKGEHRHRHVIGSKR